MSRPWHMAYLAAHPFIGFSLHKGIAPPAPKPTPLPHLSFGVLYGSMLFSQLSAGHDKGDELGPGELPFVGRTSDAGLIVPHVSLPLNPMLPLTILLGQSNSLFGSSDVKLACHNLLFGDSTQDIACAPIPAAPLGFNLACFHPIPLPTDMVVCPNSVLVGMSLADWITSLVDIAVQIAGAVVMNKLGKVVKPYANKAKGMLGKAKMPAKPAWLAKVKMPSVPKPSVKVKAPSLKKPGWVANIKAPSLKKPAWVAKVKAPRLDKPGWLKKAPPLQGPQLPAKPSPLLRQGAKKSLTPAWHKRVGATLKRKWGDTKQGWGALRKQIADDWQIRKASKQAWEQLKNRSHKRWELIKDGVGRRAYEFKLRAERAGAAVMGLEWASVKRAANNTLPPALRPYGGKIVSKYLTGILFKGGKKFGVAVLAKGNPLGAGTRGDAAIEIDGLDWDPFGLGTRDPDAPKWSRRVANHITGEG